MDSDKKERKNKNDDVEKDNQLFAGENEEEKRVSLLHPALTSFAVRTASCRSSPMRTTPAPSPLQSRSVMDSAPFHTFVLFR